MLELGRNAVQLVAMALGVVRVVSVQRVDSSGSDR